MYLFIVIICCLTFILISASGLINKTPVAMLGACLVMLFGAVADHTLLIPVDLNVVFMLMGVMIIGDILADTGVFEWFAIASAKKMHGNGMLTVTALMVIAAVSSALLSTPVTLVYLIPVTILLAQILDLPVKPVLAMQAYFAGLGGSLTLVGSPVNFMTGLFFNISFLEVLREMILPVTFIGSVWLILIWIFKGRSLVVSTGNREHVMKSLPEKAITDRKTLKRALIPVSVTLMVLIFGTSWFGRGLEGVILLFGALVTGFLCRFKITPLLHKVNWSVIMFYGSVCILVGGLEAGTLLPGVGEYIFKYSGGDFKWLPLAVLCGTALLAVFVENIALTVLMLPLIQLIAVRFQVTDIRPVLWALMLGIMLGGSISLYGSAANFALARLAKRNKYKISGTKFCAGGFPLAFIGLMIATAWLYLKYIDK
ncbi:MAG: SLC13 family permease [Victivallaceae bacterium]|nr:SLC13 family permease [Victivallaceae bacterium]